MSNAAASRRPILRTLRLPGRTGALRTDARCRRRFDRVAAQAPTMPPAYQAPPSQPMYGPPPSQPMYGPPTGPFQAMGPAPVSSRLGQMLRAAPPTAAPSNRIQAFMQRNVSAPMATNPWFMAVAGAVLALVSGLILTAIAEALWSAALDQALAVYATSALNQVASGMVKSLLAPDLLKFYLFSSMCRLPFMPIFPPAASAAVAISASRCRSPG